MGGTAKARPNSGLGWGPRAAVLAAVLLSGCVPTMQAPPPELPVTALEPPAYLELAAPFRGTLAELGVELKGGQAYRYEGEDTNAFLQAVNRFYRENPGFCPLENAFYPATGRSLYLTLTARESEVRGFLYDQSRRPNLTYAYFSGTSKEPLKTVACRTPTG